MPERRENDYCCYSRSFYMNAPCCVSVMKLFVWRSLSCSLQAMNPGVRGLCIVHRLQYVSPCSTGYSSCKYKVLYSSTVLAQVQVHELEHHQLYTKQVLYLYGVRCTLYSLALGQRDCEDLYYVPTTSYYVFQCGCTQVLTYTYK